MHKDSYEPKFSWPIAPWFKWFAWHPVYTIDRGWRWLIFVWKRPCQVKEYLSHNGGDIWWQHIVKKG